MDFYMFSACLCFCLETSIIWWQGQANTWRKGANSRVLLSQTDNAEILLSILDWSIYSKWAKYFSFHSMKTSSFSPLGLKTFVRSLSEEIWKYWVWIISDCERQSGLLRRLMNSAVKGNPVLLLMFCVTLYWLLKPSWTCSNFSCGLLRTHAPHWVLTSLRHPVSMFNSYWREKSLVRV